MNCANKYNCKSNIQISMCLTIRNIFMLNVKSLYIKTKDGETQ